MDAAAGVDPANVDKAIDLMLHEMARFVNEPVTADRAVRQPGQLHRAAAALARIQRRCGGALINLERYDLGLDYYRRYPDLVTSVTPEEILAAAQRYIDPSRVAIAVAGP